MTKQTRLEDIPFAETLAEEPAAPRLRDLFSQQEAEREAARLHWFVHVKDGVLNPLFHHSLKLCPPAFASAFGNLLVPVMRWSYRDKLFPQRISRNFETLTVNRWNTDTGRKAGLKRWWHNIGRTMSEFCLVNKLWKSARIEVEGLEHLKAAQAKGAPVIFTSMHLGTWEALFVAIHEGLAGPSIGPFQPEPNRFKNRIVHAIRKERNQYLFPPGQRSAYRLHRLMNNGQYSMTIFVDEVRDKQVHLPSFGRPLPKKGNATVAVKIANSCGGTIIPTYLVRLGPARFRMVLLPPLQRPEETTGYDLQETIRAMNDVFEPIVLEHIEEWYMLGELRLPRKFAQSAYAKALSEKNQVRKW